MNQIVTVGFNCSEEPQPSKDARTDHAFAQRSFG